MKVYPIRAVSVFRWKGAVNACVGLGFLPMLSSLGDSDLQFHPFGNGGIGGRVFRKNRGDGK